MSPDPARPFVDRLALRVPWLVRLGLRLLRRRPPDSRLRREVVRRLITHCLAAVNRRDLDAAARLAFEPDLTLRAVGFGVGTPELLHGHAGVAAFFAEWEQAMGWPEFTVREIIDEGDLIRIRASLAARGRHSGIQTENREAGAVGHLSQRGLIQALEFHWNWKDALATAGEHRAV